jgi:hypothetical protein
MMRSLLSPASPVVLAWKAAAASVPVIVSVAKKALSSRIVSLATL